MMCCIIFVTFCFLIIIHGKSDNKIEDYVRTAFDDDPVLLEHLNLKEDDGWKLVKDENKCENQMNEHCSNIVSNHGCESSFIPETIKNLQVCRKECRDFYPNIRSLWNLKVIKIKSSFHVSVSPE